MDDFISVIFQELIEKTNGVPDLSNPQHFTILSEILYSKGLSSDIINGYKSNIIDYINKGE